MENLAWFFLGEDSKYRLTELNSHGPTVKGWRSERNCIYPQEIVLKLEKKCVLSKIQILAHQFMIRKYVTLKDICLMELVRDVLLTSGYF